MTNPLTILFAFAAGFALCYTVSHASPAILPGAIELRDCGGRRCTYEPSLN